jgi:NADPH-dependent 7-cyano-7-deazaguanine reductase QueF
LAHNIKRKNRGFLKSKRGKNIIHEECVRSIEKHLVTENSAFLCCREEI